MTDRQPKYPGRVTLTPVPGQPNKYDMVRADEPTDPGTPLNKATLLKDSTAARFGPGVETPNEAFAKLGARLPPPLIAEYKTAGAYTWDASAWVGKKLLIAAIGAGGGGCASKGQSASGGSSGLAVVKRFVLDNSSLSIVVGAGGTGGEYSNSTSGYAAGNAGGTTSVAQLNIALSGGGGGNYFTSSGLPVGGQPSEPIIAPLYTITSVLWGGYNSASTASNVPTTIPRSYSIFNTLSYYRIFPFFLVPGYSIGTGAGATTSADDDKYLLPNGKYASIPSKTNTGAATAIIGQDPGCGGSNAIVHNPGNTDSATGADGCDGGIFIYDLTNWEG